MLYDCGGVLRRTANYLWELGSESVQITNTRGDMRRGETCRVMGSCLRIYSSKSTNSREERECKGTQREVCFRYEFGEGEKLILTVPTRTLPLSAIRHFATNVVRTHRQMWRRYPYKLTHTHTHFISRNTSTRH